MDHLHHSAHGIAMDPWYRRTDGQAERDGVDRAARLVVRLAFGRMGWMVGSCAG